MPSATATADPELEPPAVFEISQGLRVTPYSGEFDAAFQPSSGVVVLPIMTAPASSRRSTAGAVSVDTDSA